MLRQTLIELTRFAGFGAERSHSDKEGQVSFRWKDYKHENRQNSKVMTIVADEFIRRFLIHTLPPGFQRIRYFGFPPTVTDPPNWRSVANCRSFPLQTCCRSAGIGHLMRRSPIPPPIHADAAATPHSPYSPSPVPACSSLGNL